MNEIDEITILQLQEMYRIKEISVKETVEEYLKRITIYDQGEGKLNSILEINPDALTIAEELDEHRKEYSGRLYGVPILLKDNIDTGDRMHTSAGSIAFQNSFAGQDANIVRTMREKGAVILGKTNMTEFANYMTKGMKTGYSSRGGEVKSPYKKNHDPSGSSTGSAVAVSSNLCTAAMGTDTAGSILSPSNNNGIVGLRPSIGKLSMQGIIPISQTLDTVGPMTRTVMDTAIIFSELMDSPMILNEWNMNKTIIGIDYDSFHDLTAEEEKKAVNMMKKLRKSGAILKDIHVPKIPTENLNVIKRYEFKYCINKYLEYRKDPAIGSLNDIIEFNEKNPEAALRYGQTYLIDAEKNTKGDLSETVYQRMLKDRENTRKDMIDRLNRVDVCLHFHENLIIQYTGLPSITLPIGLYNNGTPNGIFLTCLEDEKLLRHALAIEKVIGNRQAPKMLEHGKSIV